MTRDLSIDLIILANFDEYSPLLALKTNDKGLMTFYREELDCEMEEYKTLTT